MGNRFTISKQQYPYTDKDDIDNIILYDDDNVFGTYRHPLQIDYWSFKRFIEQQLDFLAKNPNSLRGEYDNLLRTIIKMWQDIKSEKQTKE